MLTGTWLERLKLVAGLRFLLAVVPTLLLALLAEFFRFLLFVVVCRAGSALARPAKRNRGHAKNIMHTDGDRVWGCVCAECIRARGQRVKALSDVRKHGCSNSLYTCKHAERTEACYTNPCFAFFRGETTQVLTSPKSCTSKKEPFFFLHKCSTMDPGARRNVDSLMVSAKQRVCCSSIARTRLKLL